jgi:hypothetical protein
MTVTALPKHLKAITKAIALDDITAFSSVTIHIFLASRFG